MKFNAKINIKDLEKLASRNRISKNIAFSMAESANKIHQGLERDIKATFTIPKGQTLQSVRVGKSISTVKTGKNFIQTGLEYRHKKTPLKNFPTQINTVSRESKYMLEDSRRVHLKYYAYEVKVKMFKRFETMIRAKQPVFKIKGKGVSDNDLYYRTTNKTWEPGYTDTRAEYRTAYGMSVAQMANYILKTPSKSANVNKAILKAVFNIKKAIRST